ncbi:glycosyltransferase family 4 protein [Ferruginibacter albus]|uniref:glycosyltransferase family 4 protein n=1 Tax=Ferruginibacter albus TaxID=2875540 RepID=UPI001CC7F108|nr:glycosyltransferase family 4 protein [Ferruginibacter albus]UAY50677.1 glycosyltransferase family 4 protein [Ferruginibacter albus]
MKILTITFSAGMGGTERAAVNYAIGYNKLGCDSKVLVIGDDHHRVPDLLDAGVETFLLKDFLNEQGILFDKLKEWGPDIIHLHHFSHYFFPIIDKVKKTTTKVVETNVFSRAVYDPKYNYIDLSMQLSQWGYWKYTIAMKGAAYVPAVAVIPYTFIDNKFNGASQSEIKAYRNLYNIPDDAFVVGRLGQAHPSKWSPKIIDVIKSTVKQSNNIYYLFVGMPDVIKKELSSCSDLIRSRVCLIDKIEGDNNLNLYYSAIDCFAHIAKIGESFGYVLAEAIACGVPVITMLTPFRDNAQFEVVGHNYGGICAINTDQFTNAILKLYDQPELIRKIKENQAGWVQKRFSLEVVIPQQIDIYRKILNNEKLPDINAVGVVKQCLKQFYGITAPFVYIALVITNSRKFRVSLAILKKLIKK